MNDQRYHHSLLSKSSTLNVQDLSVATNTLNTETLKHLYKTPFANQKFWPIKDIKFMQLALEMAQNGYDRDEVPVGAILVADDKIIGTGYNQPITSCDPTAHAEIVALRSACQTLQNYRLPPNSTLYVTLEPCTMCIGALIHARLSRLVFATTEPKAGMVGSQLNLNELECYNHHISINQGLLTRISQQKLKAFFKERREKGRKKKN